MGAHWVSSGTGLTFSAINSLGGNGDGTIYAGGVGVVFRSQIMEIIGLL
jgi:hypothetical protein